MDYSVWAILERKVCSTRHPNSDSLKEALLKSWDEIDETYLRATCEAFVGRLKNCTLIELFRLAFALQSLAVDQSMAFSNEKRIALHNLVAKYMNLAAQLMANPSLCQHVQQVGYLVNGL
ncbi:unnamed protein product [Nippostrongylus brasiliensis]|uniref:NR LBD domain-containing protein n=1 Tax=Nippostrongylus brasiliensis TaxID=27835 RepID=A0A0N4XLM7_NIPBR|nr:unnamed protein product [Nippostrongylus brasiliensis]